MVSHKLFNTVKRVLNNKTNNSDNLLILKQKQLLKNETIAAKRAVLMVILKDTCSGSCKCKGKTFHPYLLGSQKPSFVPHSEKGIQQFFQVMSLNFVDNNFFRTFHGIA